jgi:hypothetical protein
MRKIATFVIAGTAASLASAQSNLDIERAYAAELSADAANRSSLLQGAGEGTGFSLTSGDGASTLNINAFFQFRYVASFRDDGQNDANGLINDNDFAGGFEIPRARIDFSGNVHQDNIKYRISGDFGYNNNTLLGNSDQHQFQVTWAYGQYEFEGTDGLFFRFGQFKAPLTWEELVDPEFQLAGERSVANEMFSGQWVQGIMLGYEAESFRGYFSVNDGLISAGTGFNQGGEADVGLTVRGEFKFAGDWAQFTDFTSWRNSDYAGKVGAAFHWETFGDSAPVDGGAAHPAGAPAPVNGGSNIANGSLIVYTIDTAIEGNGWNASAAFYGSWIDGDPASGVGPLAEDNFDDYGVYVQGGIFLTEQIEAFARWDAIFLDDDRISGGGIDDDINFLTFGANYYVIPESHAIKASLELLWALNDTTALWGTPAGLNSTNNASISSYLGQDDDGEIAIRAQVGVLF